MVKVGGSIPSIGTIGVYSLTLIRCRKDNWLHGGSTPLSPTMKASEEFAYLGKLDTGTMKDWLQMAKKMNCTYIAVVMTWALGERNKGNL